MPDIERELDPDVPLAADPGHLERSAPADQGGPEALVAEYFRRLLIDRDLSVCDELLADDYLDHDALPGTPPGPAATRAFVADLLEAHPDLTFVIDELVSIDNHVALRARWCGTNARTGTVVDMRGLLLIRVDGSGRLAERRSSYSEPPA
jgi:hypothetical protein